MLQSIKPGAFIFHNQSMCIRGIHVCSEQVETQDDLDI